MSFDYPWTCPDIDRQISSIKEELICILDDAYQDACPLLESGQRRGLAEKEGSLAYDRIEDYIEEIRATNEKMRKAAEKQIEALTDEIANLESELKQAQAAIE